MGDPASAAPGAAPSRRLAAIMFTDLVGYSALAHRDEALAIELLDLHRGWVRAILPPHSGREIETVGDAFLIEFPGALAALSCALAIQRRFAEHNAEAPAGRRMQLRIGVHLGDVEHRGDKVVGDGVNIASRIHGMAEPGGICVSEDVQHAVRNRAGFRFESLGTPMLKNIEAKLELFRVLAPQPAPAPSPQPAAAQRRMRGPLAATAGALVAAAVIAAVAVWALRGPPAPAMPSVAVLPFENLSAEPDSAYFTDGLHDTVIGHLARVRNLKVISRTSVMGYRGKSAGLKAIARELDVNHVVEGSVQRAGGRLRVVAQLIETGTDTHVWSSEYDRDLADVFAVQADIARQVATAVHAKLTPQESTQIARVATRNAEAYDLYLRALQAWRRVEIDEAVVRGMLESLERAVALDPEFALAHALLAQAHDSIHWFGGDPSTARRALAAKHAEIALRLDPTLAEAHVAYAQHLYHGARDYDAAIRELETAQATAPGNGDIQFWLAMIHRRQGRWDQAILELERVAALDPLNTFYLFEHAGTYVLMHRHGDAERLLARLEGMATDPRVVRLDRASNRYAWTGDLAGLEQVVESLPPDFDPFCRVSLERFWIGLARRKFEEAARSALGCRGQLNVSGSEQLPPDYLAAMAYHLGGIGALARQHAVTARRSVEDSLREHPDRASSRMALAHLLIVLGDADGARRQAGRALEQMPVTRDAVIGPELMLGGAAVHAIVGDRDRALELLGGAVRIPGAAAASGHLLRRNPFFDSLRDDARFRRLIEESLPKPDAPT